MAAAALPRIAVPADLLQRADGVGMFPAMAAQIEQIASDPKASAADLARAIEKDPILAARLLKLSNAPGFAARRTVTTLKDAIALLGFRTTRDLAIAMCIGGKAERASPEARAVWKHSLRVGAANRLLARHVRRCNPSQALIAGILHDVGALVMCQLDRRYARMSAKFEDGSPELMEAEKALYGVDHAALGAGLMLKWQLPEEFVDVAAQHHTRSNVILVVVSQLAELISEGKCKGPEEYAATEPAQRLKLGERQIQEVLDAFDGESSAIRKL